ncbi:hypothetical protein LLEC1_01070 [Akanthomyces lecanii]|uniref:Uncharacterized protein n=1 Tax=Cordyceps confragosa TaxID=2714763 RepID=A0A179ID12_CORDF|nr:hypothetical protein LLEC1_01070 [Akanthomyces lecanii]
MVPRSWIAVVVSLASLAAASWPDPPLSGHDFGFSADFKDSQDGPKTTSKSSDAITFSTEKAPTADDVIQANSTLYSPAVITLLKPDDAARSARYIAFFEISFIPTTDTLDDVIYKYPWIRSNLTVHDSGELATTGDTVWRQDDNLERYIDSVESGRIPMPLVFALSQVFTNTTDNVSYGFKRASIDFKIQNKTGVARCDVNSNGAPVPGISRGATACAPTPTSTSKAGGGAAGASATPSPSSTSKHNAAAGIVGSSVLGGLAMAVAGALVL